MNLLLETHTLLWLMESNPKLSARAAALIPDRQNALYLSHATIWEIAIKSGMGKLGLAVSYQVFLQTAIDGYGLTVMPITLEDCIAYQGLPFPDPQHRDPFDRMLIVQALRHGLEVLGVDHAFDAYPLTRVW